MTIIIAVMLGFICSSCGKDTVKPIPTPTPTPTPVPTITAPASATNIVATTPAPGTLKVSFDTGANGGAKIVNYTVTVSRVDSPSVAITKSNADGSPFTITGLKNGKSYVASVVITNEAQKNSPANSASAVLVTSANTRLLVGDWKISDIKTDSSGIFVSGKVTEVALARVYTFVANFKFTILNEGNVTGPFDWAWLDDAEKKFKMSGNSGTLTFTDKQMIFEFESPVDGNPNNLLKVQYIYIRK